MFICDHELRDIWVNHNLTSLFPSSKYSDEERKKIGKDYLRVLSILILVGWSLDDLVTKFRTQFLRAPGRADRDLPLNRDQLSFLNNSAFTFTRHQYHFVPAVIEQSDTCYIQEIKDRPLPFTKSTSPVGDGAFGTVSFVTIAPRCIQLKKGNFVNSDVCKVAI